MPVSHVRRLSTTGAATVALAAAGLVAPATPAHAVGISLSPASPVAGQSFTATLSALTANASYRVALTGTAVDDKTDRAESNSCGSTAKVTGTTLECAITEASGGSYELKVLDANDNTVHNQAVTVNTVVALPQASKPVATDGAGTANDAITVTKLANVTWQIDGTPVVFAANETTHETKLVATDPSKDYVVTATTDAGYAFADGSTTWTQTYRLTTASPTEAALPTPTAPVVIDKPGTADDAVQLAAVPHVTWAINGVDVPWTDGATSKTLKVTPDADGNVTITAKAAAGRVFAGASPFYDFVYPYSSELAEPTTTRIAGPDRVQTAVEVSKKYFPGKTETVYVANAMNFPDALAAGPAAARAESPLLLTFAGQAPQSVIDEVKRLSPATIQVVGGTSVVSSAVERQLAAIAPVTRLEGSTRYSTAAAVAGKWASAGTVYIALGTTFPDALSAGSGAAAQNAPLLLSDGNSLNDDTVAALRRLAPSKVVLVGGEAVLRASVVRQVKDVLPAATTDRYAGADRYATSASVIANVTGKPATATTAFLATGRNFPDALAGVPAAAKAKAPLALTVPSCLPFSVKTQLDKLPLTDVTRLGGVDVLGNFSLKSGC